MAGFLRVVRSLALLLARVGLGGILILHGWRRWQEQGIESQIAYLKTFATPYASYAAWGGTVLEMVAGLFLIVGAVVPLAAAAIVVEQVLIVAYTSWYKGWSLTHVQGTQTTWAGGWEYSVVLGLLALLLVVYGGGDVAIDRLFRRSKKDEVEEEPATEQRQRLAPRTGLGSTTSGSSSTPSSTPSAPSSPSPRPGGTSGSSRPSGTSGTSGTSDATGSSNSTTDTLIRPKN